MVKAEQEIAPSAMSLGEHLEELRGRVIWSAVGLVVALVVTLVFGRRLFDLLAAPYREVVASGNDPATLTVLKMTGGVFFYFRVCLYAALVMAAPWIFYQAWMFVAAGLYEREKRIVSHSVPFSGGLFVAGAVFFLFVVSLPMLRFFHAFNAWLGVEEVITLESHIRFMTGMMLVFGVGFQMPLAVFVLARTGLISAATLNHYRRHVIIGILIFAAICTSPSPLDQILLAVPMWLLYEIGVLLVYLRVVRPKKLQAREKDASEKAEE